MRTRLGRPALPPVPIRTPLPATDSLSPCSPQTSPGFCSWSGFIPCPEPLRPSPQAACSAEWRSSRVLGRAVPLLLLTLVFNPRVIAQDVRIGVLGLFHPNELQLQASGNEAVIIHAACQTFVLEPGSRMATIHISSDALLLDFGGHVLRTAQLLPTSRNASPLSFLLAVPR